MKELKLRPIKVYKNEKITDDTSLMSFPRDFDFSPGQVLGITHDPNLTPRMYSICSGKTDEHVEILYKIVTHGAITPPISLLNPNDQIYITQPYGRFFGTNSPAYLISNGTGIAPFISYLRSGMQTGKTIIHGAQDINHCYFKEYLATLHEIKYIQCLSRQEQSGTFFGRLTCYLELAELEKDALFFLCGSNEMVIEAREILLSKGIHFGNIHCEIYF